MNDGSAALEVVTGKVGSGDKCCEPLALHCVVSAEHAFDHNRAG
jgi:hypothetical protein